MPLPSPGAHYFCETIDLTRPFPSDRPVTQPSWDFVWNRWLTASFRGIGLDFVCPPLMQVGEARCPHLRGQQRARAAAWVHGPEQCALHAACRPQALGAAMGSHGLCRLGWQGGRGVCEACQGCLLRDKTHAREAHAWRMPCAIMQGLCEERALSDFDGARYWVVLISRRGRLHVGPRYKARGLNDYAEPGNEIECEQVSCWSSRWCWVLVQMLEQCQGQRVF